MCIKFDANLRNLFDLQKLSLILPHVVWFKDGYCITSLIAYPSINMRLYIMKEHILYIFHLRNLIKNYIGYHFSTQCLVNELYHT